MAKKFDWTDKQLKIIGKVTNIERGKRLLYLQGMLDYIDVTHTHTEEKFMIALYNYVAEYGDDTSGIMEDFCHQWKNEVK